jgi:hypothetical protein
MQIPILNGIKADRLSDFRSTYPRNLVPVPKGTGISQGYLAPAYGLQADGVGPGKDRGGYNWRGVLYRVMGTKFCRIDSGSAITILGDVGGAGPVTFDSSFDVMGIVSGGRLWYWDGATLTSLNDTDAGTVIDAKWISGYWQITDGVTIAVTELTDRYSVNPLKYGSAESDPDPIMALDELRNESYALGRYTIEASENVGGANYPFQRIDGATVPRGILGTHTYCQINSTFAFLGSGKTPTGSEPPAVYVMVPGDSQKISTREIDKILKDYTEEELSTSVMEAFTDEGNSCVYLHLPDQCLVYDFAASAATQVPVWYTLSSSVVGESTYRARGLCWCYDRWNVGDPTSTTFGRLTKETSEHYGQPIGWEFGTLIVYNEGNGAIFHQLELVGTPGRIPMGKSPVIWTSYSHDGETWSQERSVNAGKQGERNKRLVWFQQGDMANYRMQRFRGTSDARMSIARLEAQMEPLYA